jgi:hypothetical protein
MKNNVYSENALHMYAIYCVVNFYNAAFVTDNRRIGSRIFFTKSVF